jgi:hypothetical protein
MISFIVLHSRAAVSPIKPASQHHNTCSEQISNKGNSTSLCLPSNNRKFAYYSLFVPTNAHTHIYIYILLNYIANAPTCFGASAPSSGSFGIVFAKVIKY